MQIKSYLEKWVKDFWASACNILKGLELQTQGQKKVCIDKMEWLEKILEIKAQ